MDELLIGLSTIVADMYKLYQEAHIPSDTVSRYKIFKYGNTTTYIPYDVPTVSTGYIITDDSITPILNMPANIMDADLDTSDGAVWYCVDNYLATGANTGGVYKIPFGTSDIVTVTSNANGKYRLRYCEASNTFIVVVRASATTAYVYSTLANKEALSATWHGGSVFTVKEGSCLAPASNHAFTAASSFHFLHQTATLIQKYRISGTTKSILYNYTRQVQHGDVIDALDHVSSAYFYILTTTGLHCRDSGGVIHIYPGTYTKHDYLVFDKKAGIIYVQHYGNNAVIPYAMHGTRVTKKLRRPSLIGIEDYVFTNSVISYNKLDNTLYITNQMRNPTIGDSYFHVYKKK